MKVFGNTNKNALRHVLSILSWHTHTTELFARIPQQACPNRNSTLWFRYLNEANDTFILSQIPEIRKAKPRGGKGVGNPLV